MPMIGQRLLIYEKTCPLLEWWDHQRELVVVPISYLASSVPPVCLRKYQKLKKKRNKELDHTAEKHEVSGYTVGLLGRV